MSDKGGSDADKDDSDTCKGDCDSGKGGSDKEISDSMGYSDDAVAAELRSCVWVTTPTVGEARCLTGEFLNSSGNLYPTGAEAIGSGTSAIQEKVYDLDEDLFIPKDVRELGLPARLTWLERSGFVIGWKEGAGILVLMDTNMRCEIISLPSRLFYSQLQQRLVCLL